MVYLKGVGQIKVFCQCFKTESCRYYALSLLDPEALATATAEDFKQLHTLHWGIECFHRVGKQLCALRRFRMRVKDAIHIRIFCSLRAFVELDLQSWQQLLGNWDELQRRLYQETARHFILVCIATAGISLIFSTSDPLILGLIHPEELVLELSGRSPHAQNFLAICSYQGLPTIVKPDQK